jgi:hypothetical protein
LPLPTRRFCSFAVALSAGAALGGLPACEGGPLSAAPAGTTQPPTPDATDQPPGSTAGGEFGPGGSCDIQALMALPENGCTNAGCHGVRFQGGLDLLSPGPEQRLVGVASQSEACSGELLIDTTDVEKSLLLRLVDPVRFEAAPCGVMMPFGSPSGVSTAALACFEGWLTSLAQGTMTPVVDPALEFEPVAPQSYVNKVKTLLIGRGASVEEVASVEENPEALRDLVAGWLQQPEFAAKLHDFLGIALQQKLVGSLDTQFMRLRGSKLAALRSNLQESFIRTAVEIVQEGRPFSEILTTRRWAMTTASLSALAFLERTAADLRMQKHTVFRDPGDGLPTPPVDPQYSVENRIWHLASLPVDCEVSQINAEALFELMLGFVQCKGPGQYRFEDTLLTEADFVDWRFVDIDLASTDEQVPLFYDLEALRAASSVALQQPRLGFFTTPAFLANWETNEDNQFRVVTSQSLIVALGEIFSPADPTMPTRLDGLSEEHSAPGSTCYGCHQFLDPMRTYFAQNFSYDYQRPEQPSQLTASFAFQGYVHDAGGIEDFAAALLDHPDFATGWTQKLCYWANSQPCDKEDAEFLRVAHSFRASGFDFRALLLELMSSSLVTAASFTETYRTSEPLISITRKHHLCQLLDTRLGVPDACGVAASFASLVPEDDFSRGAAEPVQTAVTGLFHYAAVEKLCQRLATKLVGNDDALRFPASAPEAALDTFVNDLMGLAPGHPRHDGVRASLGEHYLTGQQMSNTLTALRSAFIVACVSPEVQAVGL